MLLLFSYAFLNLFLAVLGLFCWAFSSCRDGDHSSLQCMGVSLRRLLLWQRTGSRALGLRGCGS